MIPLQTQRFAQADHQLESDSDSEEDGSTRQDRRGAGGTGEACLSVPDEEEGAAAAGAAFPKGSASASRFASAATGRASKEGLVFMCLFDFYY